MKKIIRYAILVIVIALVAWAVIPLITGTNPYEVSLPSAEDVVSVIVDNTSVQPQGTELDLHGPYDVVRVVDGDTAMIDIDGTETRVRFIGIDTPESVNPDESKNTEEGKQASQFTKNLLTGKRVYLEYDVEKEDSYGRTLAYLYMEDGATMVQEEILRAGMATTITIQPNSKYASRLHDVQVEAREAGTGLWATGFFG